MPRKLRKPGTVKTRSAKFKVGQKVFDKCTGRFAKIVRIDTEDVDGEALVFYHLDKSIPLTGNYPTRGRNGFELSRRASEPAADAEWDEDDDFHMDIPDDALVWDLIKKHPNAWSAELKELYVAEGKKDPAVVEMALRVAFDLVLETLWGCDEKWSPKDAERHRRRAEFDARYPDK